MGNDAILEDILEELKEIHVLLDEMKTTRKKKIQTQKSNEICYQWFVDKWNTLHDYGISRTKPITVGSKQDKAITEILELYTQSDVLETIDKIKESKYLLGKVTPQKIQLSWFLTLGNFKKVYDGRYSDVNNSRQSNKVTSSIPKEWIESTSNAQATNIPKEWI